MLTMLSTALFYTGAVVNPDPDCKTRARPPAYLALRTMQAVGNTSVIACLATQTQFSA